jgi:PAS domain-containing protein
VSSHAREDRWQIAIHRGLSVVGFVVALAALAAAVLTWSRLSARGFTELFVARRVLLLGLLFALVFSIGGVWLWRRASYLSSLSPEYKRGLMKVKRGNEWLAETSDGRWLRWDPLAADWVPTERPEDEALKRSPSAVALPPPPPEPSLPAEAHLALWQAQLDSRRRRARLRRGVFAVRGVGALVMVVALLMVAAAFALLFLGALRFISDLPF